MIDLVAFGELDEHRRHPAEHRHRHRSGPDPTKSPTRLPRSPATVPGVAALAAELPPPEPSPARSNISVVLATAQPLFLPPIIASSPHAGVGEEDLVEHRATGHLPQRADVDARLVHVDREVGDALVLGHVGSVRAISMPMSAT